MSPFHFLKLPLLAQKGILRQCEILTIIELSFVSEKFKRFLKSFKMEVESFRYDLTPDKYKFNVNSSSGNLSICYFRCSYGNFVGNWNTYGNALLILERLEYSVVSEECTDGWSMETLEKLTKHLLSVFQVKNFQLDINIGISNLFIWKYSKCFDTININRFHHTPIEFTPAELGFLLEDLQINHLHLKAQIKDDPNFKYHFQNQGSSKVRKIEIGNPSWVNYDHLLYMANKSISCHIPEGFSRTANEILKKWMSGTNETLEKLALFPSGEEEPVNEQVLEGTNATPSVFHPMPLSFPRVALNVMDIRREHDGCQATLTLSRCAMRMFVWNKKHLEVVGRLNLN